MSHPGTWPGPGQVPTSGPGYILLRRIDPRLRSGEALRRILDADRLEQFWPQRLVAVYHDVPVHLRGNYRSQIDSRPDPE